MVVSDHSPCPAELKRPRRGDFGRRLGRDQLAAAGAAAGLDRGPAARARARRRGPLDGRGAPPTGPGLRHKGRIAVGRRRRPVRVRARRDVRRRPGPAAPPAPGHAVRRTDAHRRRPRRPGWPGAAVDLDAPPRGRLLTRGGTPMSHDFTALPDLASRALGGSVVHANDELFAARENLITPGPAVHARRAFGHGQGLRRLGDPPPARARQRLAIVRLGVPGVVQRRRRRHRLLHRQLPAARVAWTRSTWPATRRRRSCSARAWEPLVPVSRGRGRHRQRVRGRRPPAAPTCG